MVVNIHFVTGNKGNVGKTAWSEALVAFYTKQKKKLLLIDGDKDVPVLSKTCSDVEQVVFSDNPGLSTQPDTISEIAYKESKKGRKSADILVDLPAGGERHLNEWMDDCSLDILAERYNFKLIKWWVSDADVDSIRLFQESIEKYPGIRHIFLKNMGKSLKGQWEDFDSNETLKALIISNDGAVLEIPRADPAIINGLRTGGIPLTKIVEDEEFKLASIGVNLRVNTWVRRTGALAEQIIPLGKPQDSVQKGSPEQAAIENSPPEQAAVPTT